MVDVNSEEVVGLFHRPTLTSFRLYSGRVENNTKSETNRAERTLEKFWTKVDVKPQEDNHYAVALDSSPIKTPKGNRLVVPSSTVAHLLAQEWSVITSLKIKPHSLPLTSLAARAIDLQDSPNERRDVVEYLMPYLDTDTLLVFAPSDDCEGTLRMAQENQYRPVINRAEDFWKVRLNWLDGDTMLFGNTQTEETKAIVREWIEGLNPWQFAALERATITAKSLIAGLLVLNRSHTVDQIADLVNLEIIHQTKLWGEVEDTHDVNHADLRRYLGSAYVVSGIGSQL
ncbi:hypothetical protein TRICI_001305 [Trichomonascus ciferrii]|uniref:ATP synthase mitochondrial F1 complex assembly factor 2 n=1 Tax=Trichomonascus ciferrii TaxID=44093 RepID=A0A642V9Q3_9ASCO|nr:hypothetical protein TRICI_001305 [Trichomonascus ciferrii]